MWFIYVIGVIQMCSMKVYDHGNLTICYELTVCSFKTKNVGGHGARFVTNRARNQSPWLSASDSPEHAKLLLSYTNPRVFI